MAVELRYTPGDGYLAAGPTLTIFSPDPLLVARMWPVVRDGGDTAVVLAGALGGGFDSLADLVLIEGGPERAEILVRGDIDVTATATSGVQRIDGRGVRTWREAGVEQVTLLRVGATGEPAVELSLVCGIVRASGFHWADGTPPTLKGAASVGAPVPPPPVSRQLAPPPTPAVPPTPAPPPVPDLPSMPVPADPIPVEPLPVEPVPAAPSVPSALSTSPPAPYPDANAWPAPAGGSPAPTPPEPAREVATRPALDQTRLGGGDEFDHLFESTVLRSPEDAAVRTDPDEDADAPAAAPLGDHDGSTILGGQLAALLRAGREEGSSALPPPPPPPAAAPPALVLGLPNGQTIPVEGPIVIGRKPQVDRVSGNQIPRLVTVTGPSGDISRSHLQIHPDGNELIATDLGSTNGTVLIGPHGSHPLTAHVPERCAAGARFDLGDGVVIDVRAAR